MNVLLCFDSVDFFFWVYVCTVLCCYGNCQFEETGLWVVVNSHGKFKSCGEALLESAV